MADITTSHPNFGFHIDWLSATVKESDKRADFSFVAAFDDLGERKPCKPLHGYNRAWGWDFGAMVMWHDSKPAMGTHFVLSGKPLKFLHEHDYDAIWLTNRFTQGGARLTRIDLAFDAYNSGNPSPADLYYKFKRGEKQGRARNAGLIDRTDTGETFYIGSWKSARFARYYDKGKEQKCEGDWKRLELVNKEGYARSFQVYFAQDPTLKFCQEVFRGTINSMLKFDLDTWKEMMLGEAQKISLPEHIGGKTREWLLTQVAAAIAKVMYVEGDEMLWDDLAREVQLKIDELIKKG